MRIDLKRDIKELELSTKHALRELDDKVSLRLAETRTGLLRWTAGMLLAQTGLIAALVKLL